MTDMKSHWEAVYADKSPLEVSWFQKKPLQSLRFIDNAGLKLVDAIIDVGGGASRLVDYLLILGFSNLSVLDISDKALASSRQRLGNKAQAIKWYAQDITTFNTPEVFRLWHDRAVFHFLTNAGDRKKYVDILNHSLQVDGHLIMAAFAPGGPTRCSNLDIVQYDADKLLAELGSNFCLLEKASELHITPVGKEQQFNYFHLLKTA